MATPKKTTTVTAVAEDLILKGKSNAQVFAALRRRFKLDEAKSHYPRWYRARLVRTGQLSRTAARKAA